MFTSRRFLSILATASFSISIVLAQGFTESSLVKHSDSLALTHSFNPIKDSYWTGYPHHRRTPFAVSPDGKAGFIAYLDASGSDVHIQQVDPQTFAGVGATVTVTGAKEAGGLVAHNDGFALLTNEILPTGTTDAPADSMPVPVLYRYKGSTQVFKTFLGGPGVHPADGLHASPDLNGDLVFSEASQTYGAYFVVTAYSGWASGHFGDSVQYVDTSGALQTIPGASSSWGCSHNTGIAFEAADEPPFASVCAEDQGALWLNTKTQSMSGVKISNEHVINGGSGEPLGGMSGSYSSLARMGNGSNSSEYLLAWVSRGAKNLVANEWLGGGNTQASARTVGRRVAIAQMSDKYTLKGPQASSQIGAVDGDAQVNWLTPDDGSDNSNAHAAALDAKSAVVTWEAIAQPECPFDAMGCKGEFTGSYWQLVTDGKAVGAPLKSMDTFVAGDMVTMADGRVCWPYVAMKWSLDGPQQAASTTKMSFACINLKAGAVSIPSASITPSSVPSVSIVPSSVPSVSIVPSSSSVQSASTAAESVLTPVRTPSCSHRKARAVKRARALRRRETIA